LIKVLVGFLLGFLTASTPFFGTWTTRAYATAPIVATAAPQSLPALTPQTCYAAAELYFNFMQFKAHGAKKAQIQKAIDENRATPPDNDDIMIQALLDRTFEVDHPNPEQEARAFLKSCLANKGTNI
jgi:hypothetical protein